MAKDDKQDKGRPEKNDQDKSKEPAASTTEADAAKAQYSDEIYARMSDVLDYDEDEQTESPNQDKSLAKNEPLEEAPRPVLDSAQEPSPAESPEETEESEGQPLEQVETVEGAGQAPAPGEVLVEEQRPEERTFTNVETVEPSTDRPVEYHLWRNLEHLTTFPRGAKITEHGPFSEKPLYRLPLHKRLEHFREFKGRIPSRLKREWTCLLGKRGYVNMPWIERQSQQLNDVYLTLRPASFTLTKPVTFKPRETLMFQLEENVKNSDGPCRNSYFGQMINTQVKEVKPVYFKCFHKDWPADNTSFLNERAFDKVLSRTRMDRKPLFLPLESFFEVDKTVILVKKRCQINLKDLKIKTGTFSAPSFVHICRQSIQALADFHALGFNHRDVCPENFVVDLSGKLIYLTNFHLCRKYELTYDKKKEKERQADPVIDVKKLIKKTNKVSCNFYPLSRHYSGEYRRIDDLESWYYMLLYLRGHDSFICDVESQIAFQKFQLLYGTVFNDTLRKQFRQIANEILGFAHSSLKVETIDFTLFASIVEDMAAELGVTGDEPLDWEVCAGRFKVEPKAGKPLSASRPVKRVDRTKNQLKKLDELIQEYQMDKFDHSGANLLPANFAELADKYPAIANVFKRFVTPDQLPAAAIADPAKADSSKKQRKKALDQH